MGIEVECTPQAWLKLGGKPDGDSRGTGFRVGKKRVEPRAVTGLMLSVGLSTSAALAGQQKPTHTRVVPSVLLVWVRDLFSQWCMHVCTCQSCLGRLSTLSRFSLAGHHNNYVAATIGRVSYWGPLWREEHSEARCTYCSTNHDRVHLAVWWHRSCTRLYLTSLVIQRWCMWSRKWSGTQHGNKADQKSLRSNHAVNSIKVILPAREWP